MVLPVFDELLVQHDPNRRLMRFQWLDVTNTRLRPGLVHGRDLVVEHKPAHVLVDFHCLPQLSITDELWMSVHWFPRIAAQPIQRVALVYPPGYQLHNVMMAEAVLWVGRHLTRFQLQLFDEVEAALFWLTDANEQATGCLQAEWAAAVLAHQNRRR